MSTDDSCALVTGASSGIGLALCHSLVNAGYRVMGTSRDGSRLDDVAKTLGDAFHCAELDVDDDASVAALLDGLPQTWQHIDVLVNNAGHDVGGRQFFHQGDVGQWLDIIETNVRGLIRLTHAILPSMLERDSGHIVNIGSTSGLAPVPTTAVYSASKFALNGFSEALRMELEETGVRVSQVLPGMVRTGFAEARFGDHEKGEQFYRDYGKWLQPEDVARAVLFTLQQPPHANVSQLVIAPKSSPAGG